jgi:tetratricopeptide (TPR) repeat protein
MAFDINNFYRELDEYYGRYDNAATEQFLKDSLAKVEEFMIIPSSCSSCQDHSDKTAAEKYEEFTDAEKKWIIECSDARIAVLNEMACFYRGVSNWKACIDAFDDVRGEMEMRGLEKSNEYAVVILNMAGAYRLMGKLDEALETFKSAADIMNANGDASDYEYAGLYNNTGLVYQDMGNMDKAAEYFEKALEYLVKVPDNDAEIATNQANLAVAYYKAKKYDKALECLDKALDIFEQLDGGLNPHYAGALNTKAVVLFNSGDARGAAENFEKAAEKTKLIFGENKDYATACRNCSFAYEKLGNAEKAEQYKKLAQTVEEKIG